MLYFIAIRIVARAHACVCVFKTIYSNCLYWTKLDYLVLLEK